MSDLIPTVQPENQPPSPKSPIVAMLTGIQNTRFRQGGLILLHAALLVHLLLYLTSFDKTLSLSLRIMTGGIGVFVLGMIGLIVWVTPVRLERVRRQVARWQWAFIVGGVLILALVGFSLRPEWFYAQMAFTITLDIVVLYVCLYDSDPSIPHPRLLFGLGLLVIIGIIFLRIYSLSVNPSVDTVDEGWTLSWAISYLRTGRLSNWVMLGLGDSMYALPQFYVVLADWLRLVGVGIWEARLFTYLLTFLLILFSALAARNWYGKKAAWLTAGFLFASTSLMAGARIRHDIGLGISIAMSLWLYTEGIKRHRNSLHLAAGLLMAWGMFSHYHAAFLTPVVMVGLYAPGYLKQVREKRYWPEAGFWCYGIGASLGFASVVLIQVGPNLSNFLGAVQQFNLNNPQQRDFIQDTANLVLNVATQSKFEFLLIWLSVLAALWRRQIADMQLSIILVLACLALGHWSAVGGGAYAYNVPLTPLFGILVGAMLLQGERLLRPENAQIASRISVVFLFCITVLLGIATNPPLEYAIERHPIRPVAPLPAQWVREHLHPTQTVIGDHYYYLWLTDYRFGSPLIPLYIYPWDRSKYASVDDIWDATKADVFILDNTLSTYPMLKPLVESGYLERRGYKIVAQFPQDSPTVTIYQKP